MNSKIMFINPPIDVSQYEWEHSLGSRLPPIGLCSLAAYVRQHGFKMQILDAYNLDLSLGVTLKRILEFSPTHVGITATTSYVFFAAKLAKLIKEHRPQIVTIIGGVHISAMPTETMQRFPDFDIGVIGEGEETIVEILNLSKSINGLENIRGVIYRDSNGNFKKTQPRPYLQDLGKLPYPAFDLLEGFPDYYRPSITNYRKLPIASFVTSRGCPYQCTFCDRSVFGNRYRSFSAEYIVELIKELKHKYGICEICFYDDTFTVNKIRLNTICEAFIDNNLNLSWSCLGRVDLADIASLNLMKKAGCWLISYGIESASLEILNFYQKKIALSQIEYAIRITNAQGIRTRGFFMLGNPLETENTIAQIKSLLRRIPLDDIHISFFTPIPGSESYRSADKYGKFSQDWMSMDMYSPNFIPRGLNRDLLLKSRSDLYKSFYFQPRRLIRYVRILLSPKRFFEILKSGLIFLKLISKSEQQKMPLSASLSPKLIKNRFLLIKSYFKRESLVRGFPLELSIELTNHCNADCIMCPRQKMSRKKGFMDFDLFKKIVDEAKDYTELVILHLAGEPLLHPELIRMIDYCGKIGLRTMFSTNATLLDELKSKELIKSPLNLLTLSFDSVTKTTYEKIRKMSNFNGTHDNIQRFLRLKAKSRKSPYTIIQLIYLRENAGEAKDFLVKWKNSGVDAVRIKPYFNYPGLDNYLGGLPRKTAAPLKPCLLLWRQLTIYWDGTVVPCCQDFLSQMVVGDVNQESIQHIWNGERMVKMRQVHAEKAYRKLSLCKDCTMPQLSPPLLLGTVFFDDLTIKKILPKIEQFAILNNIQGLSYFT